MSLHITFKDINIQVFLQNQITFFAKFFSSFSSKGRLSMITEFFLEHFSNFQPLTEVLTIRHKFVKLGCDVQLIFLPLETKPLKFSCVGIIHTQKQLLQLFVQSFHLVRCYRRLPHSIHINHITRVKSLKN